MNVTSSRVGAIAKPMARPGNFKTTALMVGSIAVSFLGGLGLGASHFMDRARNGEVAKQQKKILVERYRGLIAERLGMDPARVGVRDLDMAAQNDPVLRNAVERIEHDRKSENRISVMATGGGMAVGGLLPGVSGIAKGGVSIAGSVVGSVASGFFNKNVLHTDDVMRHIAEQRQAGQAISTQDVMLLRIAQDETLQARIKERSGHAFHKMNDEQQAQLMQSMPELANAAAVDAQRLNSGQINEAGLLSSTSGQMAVRGGWAERVGGSRPMQGSFVQGLNAERAAAAARGATNGVA